MFELEFVRTLEVFPFVICLGCPVNRLPIVVVVFALLWFPGKDGLLVLLLGVMQKFLIYFGCW